MYLVSNVLEIWKLVFHKYYRLFFLRLIAQLFTKILHELFCQFISWTNWVYSGKFLDNCWISCQVMADMENFYNDLIIITLCPIVKLHSMRLKIGKFAHCAMHVPRIPFCFPIWIGKTGKGICKNNTKLIQKVLNQGLI